MSAEKKAPAPTATTTRSVDRKSNAGTTPDPWEACVRLEYGGDRSFAWSVREQVISTPPAERAQAEDRLLKALALPGVTDAGRQFLCQMLVLVGGARSVPALAALLRDPKAVESARYALDAIAGPEALAALREALGVVSGPAKAGLIGSIGVRGDTAARPALTAIKDSATEPALVREAATRALELLATANA